MSGYLAGKVWQSALDSTLKPTAACLADFANQDGAGIFPSNEYLVWLTGSSRATIKRHMSELRTLGVLVSVSNERGGRGKIPHYQLDADALPKRPSWKEFRGFERGSIKGTQNDTLSTKGLISEIKGLKNDTANKEEPLDNHPSVLSSPSSPTGDLELTSEEPTPPRKKKQSTADPRHRRFMELIQKAHIHYVKVHPILGAAAGNNLRTFLRSANGLDEKRFIRMLDNYHASLDHAAADSPAYYISKLPKYELGPLNKFGRQDEVMGVGR